MRNHTPIRSDAAAAVERTWETVDSYLCGLPRGAASLWGARVLELGPTRSLGAAALLACHGARVTVAGPTPVRWHDEYHVPFFQALLKSAAERQTHRLDVRPLIALLWAGRFVADVVTVLTVPLESIPCPDSAFDIVLSRAVLDHVRDVPQVLGQVARVTRPDGLGVHLVDLEDHVDPGRPQGMARAFACAGFRSGLEPLQQRSAALSRIVSVRLRQAAA